ncbi:MAG TPA: hypothetical protein VH682_11280 [Gemmataceae bacterium]|jgi:hypothetical protein
MPPRWLSAGIVAWWLAMMGWLFWHELWPNWRPGEPPQFHIDLVEEVRHRERPPTYWNVHHQNKGDAKPRDTFRAKTWTDYQQEDDTFTFHAELMAQKTSLKLFGFKVTLMKSAYRVNRAGQLRDLEFKVNFSLQTPSGGEKKFWEQQDNTEPPVQLKLWGEVRDDQFFAHCRADVLLATKHLEMDLPPAPVSHHASVLLPLHPVNRIHGLRPGQSWRQPLVDPIGDAFSALGAGGGIHYINARVLPQPQVLTGGGDPKMTCLVIEYEDEGQLVGRTWVEQDSELVQQQEAILDGDHWTMKRDNPRRAVKPSPGVTPLSPDRQPRD